MIFHIEIQIELHQKYDILFAELWTKKEVATLKR